MTNVVAAIGLAQFERYPFPVHAWKRKRPAET